MASSVPSGTAASDMARIPRMPDLERLQKIKSSGGMLDSIDEQRLRNHQLRQLRRKWIFDQRLSAREPLHPPLKWWEKIACRERAYWNKKLEYKTFADMLQGRTGAFRQLPMLMLYKFQRATRNTLVWIYLPSIPFLAFMYSHFERNPGNMVASSSTSVFPGDEYQTAKRSDIVVDMKTLQRYHKDDVPEEELKRWR